ncbi:unnamed protein product [Protopolystoma xenopodis]|uniref:Uncharacterized protein n=1 Tax=Protopolystoma xenopodis TaxID=117903 RepID=A0A448XQU0_9PLAT|nr:unnamed protein product [Protopolystoma xenopodis]
MTWSAFGGFSLRHARVVKGLVLTPRLEDFAMPLTITASIGTNSTSRNHSTHRLESRLLAIWRGLSVHQSDSCGKDWFGDMPECFQTPHFRQHVPFCSENEAKDEACIDHHDL